MYREPIGVGSLCLISPVKTAYKTSENIIKVLKVKSIVKADIIFRYIKNYPIAPISSLVRLILRKKTNPLVAPIVAKERR